LRRAKPHWHILGAGSIGCLFADALKRNGCDVTLVLRPGSGVRRLPVVVERDTGPSEHRCNSLAPEQCTTIKYLLVTTKAYDVRDAVAGVTRVVAEDVVVVLMANGMGFAEQVIRDWPALDVFCGATTEGAYKVGPQHIRHAGKGETRIGRAGMPEQPAWFKPLAGAVDNCLWDEQIDTALWLKLAVNCVINPITALHGCRNGELASNTDLAAEVASLCDEVARVCHAAGFAAVAATLAGTVNDVITGTADNRSSMLQDIEAGRRTEIDYINGYLLRVAQQHGIEAPQNRALVERILQSGN
jgi:2-dehydropantoate 2-reductase